MLTPTISVVTALSESGNPFVAETWASLLEQSRSDWEWIVVRNNGGELPAYVAEDPRVRVVESSSSAIGELKRFGFDSARGSALLELDHDDMLRPDALERVCAELHRGAGFVFSDFAEFHDQTWAPNTYDPGFGWRSYRTTWKGHELAAMSAPPATAQNLRRVEWAPNHVRAWSRDGYYRAGGHSSRPVADDHALCVATYLAGVRMVHVPECLYFYRVHAAQATKLRNAQIQEETRAVYLQHVEALALRFAGEGAKLAIDLGGGAKPRPGFASLDQVGNVDLDRPWPLPDGSVGVLRAHDAIEHFRDPVHVMSEAWRVLAPGGWFLIEVPSTDGRGAFQDASHVSFWNENSFWYYTRPELRPFCPRFVGAFQVAHIETHYPSAFHEAYFIPYVRAHLLALKPGFEPFGALS